MKYILGKIALFFTGIILEIMIGQINGQTIVKPGDVSGTWSIKSSPYIIKGDINIPAGKTLAIQPGVKVKFAGSTIINVQGNLIAEGTEKDSIFFSISDTTGIKCRNRLGWNGIHFDRRPVNWDTLKFRMPDDEEIKVMLEERIRIGDLDTSMKISLVMRMPDLVNETVMAESMFYSKQGSRLTYCRFEYATSEGRQEPYVFGGAVYIYRYSNLIIRNCFFENNYAYAGGAIFCKEAAPIIINNRITSCNAQSSGGAMAFVFSGPVILNNIICDNKSGYNGGAFLFHESSPYVLNNTLLRNKAENRGGAICCEQRITSFLNSEKYTPVAKVRFPRDASFEKINLNNVTLENTNSYYGRFINNIICDNKAAWGGGVALYATAPEFTNITLGNNTADTTGGGLFCEISSPRLTNSILYGNAKDQVYLVGKSQPALIYCSIESGISGVRKDSTCKNSFNISNISSAKPKFKSGIDYALDKGSACIDAGTPDTASLRLPATDLSGKERIVNKRIDLGALEYYEIKKAKSTNEQETNNNEIMEGTNQLFTSIFPNPTNGMFSIVMHNNIYELITLEIYSQTGSKVFINNYKADQCFEKQIDLSAFANGIYIVIVRADDVLLYKGEIIIN